MIHRLIVFFSGVCNICGSSNYKSLPLGFKKCNSCGAVFR